MSECVSVPQPPLQGVEWPLVTVIMPVRNEAAFIQRSLRSVLAQDYPPERVEILVVDGRSNDATRQLVLAEQRLHPKIRLLDNPAQIVSSALNTGLAESRGQIVVRVDGHCELPPDYVTRCVMHLARGADCVGGWLETIGENRVSKAIAAAMSTHFGVGGSAFRTLPGRTKEANTVPFPGFRREVLERAGRFDEELVRNQDDEYSYRLRKLGAKVVLAADVHSRYFSRNSYRSLASQYFQYGYWKVRVLQKHPLQMRWAQLVPAIFVVALALTIAMRFTGVAWPMLILVLAYGCANFAASLVTAHRYGWVLLPFIPAAFFLLHFCYGAGFVAGLVRFRKRWSEASVQKQFETSRKATGV